MKRQGLPAEIERSSMEIIQAELRERGICLPEKEAPVILRCIHASADFDYAETLYFSEEAVERGITALQSGISIVTDTNMALAGLSRPGMQKLGCKAYCFMADPQIAELAGANGTTRAAASMDYAAQQYPGAILAVGNAPTALFRIAEKMETGLRPAMIIGVPVGFVNVEESKKQLVEVCKRFGTPVIAAMGRKGGSSIAAAICNALIYLAADLLDPEKRGGSGTS